MAFLLAKNVFLILIYIAIMSNFDNFDIDQISSKLALISIVKNFFILGSLDDAKNSKRQFLDSFLYLYKRVCPSVYPSVRPSFQISIKIS